MHRPPILSRSAGFGPMFAAWGAMRRTVLLFSLLVAGTVAGQSLSGGVGGTGGGGGAGLGGSVVAGAFHVLLNPGQFMNTDPVEHLRDIEPRVFGGLGLSLQSAELTERTGGASANVYPWFGFRAELGASFTYRDRVMLSVNGGMGLNGYVLRLDTLINSIYHANKNAEVRLAWHTLPRRNVPRQWSFAIGFGGTFQQADDRQIDRSGLRSFTTAPRLVRPYIAPELGRFTASGKDRYEIALRYVKHLPPTPAWTNASSFNGTTTASAASDDHLALMMRYHLGTRKTVEPKAATEPLPVPATLDTLATLACKRQRVTLKLWDDAEMDGDTVSVLLNGEPALVRYGLGHKALKVRLDLSYGHNWIEVVAHNEGRIPPNTARGILRRGQGREELLIKTTRSRGEMLVLVRG